MTLSSLANTECIGDLNLLVNRLSTFVQSISADIPNVNRVLQKYETVLDRFIISVSDVEKKLISIKTRKAIGTNAIPNWILRDCAPYHIQLSYL